MMNNEVFFKDLQSRFPNLSQISYQNGTLIFPEGTLALNDFNLASLLPSTFMLSSHNLYLYLGYQYYRDKENEIVKVLDLFKTFNEKNDSIITPQDNEFLKYFANDCATRVTMYNEEAPILEQDSIFMTELIKREKIIGESFQRSTMPAGIISSTYTEKINQNFNEANEANSNNQSLNQGYALTRTKNGLPPTIPKEDTNLGIAGYSAIFLIIITTVIAGVYIAWKMLG